MFFVDDTFYDSEYLARCFSLFAKHPVLGTCSDKCLAVRVLDAPFWIALCLYMKEVGGSVFPLAPDMPLEAATRRAQRSGCSHLLVGDNGTLALERPLVIESEHAIPCAVPSLVQTSSGTTGEPKFITRSWASIDTEVASYAADFAEARDLTPLVACPTHHSYGLISGVMVALHRGVTPAILQNLNPKYVLRKVRQREASLLYASPPLLSAVALLSGKETPLYAVMTSGTSLPQPTFETLRSNVRHLHQQYGCSETGCVSLGLNISAPNDLGRPLSHLSVRSGTASAPEEILVESPEGSVIQTRDLGYLEEGRLYFVSRLDDLINVAGLKVYPREVEEVVLQMPDVQDAVAFKRLNEWGSEQVCLHFVSNIPLDHRAIREWCARRLAAYQVPTQISRVPAIPRLPNGKVSRRTLADSPL